MTKSRAGASPPLRCYGAFIAGRLDLRTIRETAKQAKLAGDLWRPKAQLRVKVIRLSWVRR